MNKLIKRIIIGGLGLVGVIIILLLVIPFFVDLNRYKPIVEEKVSVATGRSFRIGSDLKLSLFPWAGVAFSDLELGNPNGFKEKVFVTIDSFEIRIKLLSLLSKHLEVQKFIVKGPQIALIKRPDGQANWDFSTSQTPKSSPQPEMKSAAPADASGNTAASTTKLPIDKLAVGDFKISNGVVIYHDLAAGTRKEVDDFNLSLKDVSFDKPIQFDMSAKLDDQPLALAGSLGPIGSDPGKGVIPVDITVQVVDQLKASITGTVTNPIEAPEIDFALAVDPFSLKNLMAAVLPQQPIETSDPKALEKIVLDAKLKGNPSSISVTQGALALDETNLTFSLVASQFDRPNLKFDLEMDHIDLNRYLPPKPASENKTEQRPDKKTKNKSAEKTKKAASEKNEIDYTPLRRLILDGQLKAGTLIVDKSTVNDVRLAVKAKNGVFRIDPFSLNAYQGNIAGSAVVNVKSKAPVSNVDMRVTDLQIAPLVQEQMDKEIVEGTANASMKLKVVGDDPDTIKRHLNGTGELRLNDGALVGIDLASMARNAKSAFGLGQQPDQKPRTDFTELMAPFSIHDGVVSTDQTSLKSPFLRVIASGKANLVEEKIAFRIEPKVVGTIKGQGDEDMRSGILVPVLVTGSFAEPQFKPDLKAIAQQQIEKEVFENKEVKKIIEKNELQEYEKPVKNLIKGFLGD